VLPLQHLTSVDDIKIQNLFITHLEGNSAALDDTGYDGEHQLLIRSSAASIETARHESPFPI
jgi:hypothetical protein